jgi:hypothetical protein
MILGEYPPMTQVRPTCDTPTQQPAILAHSVANKSLEMWLVMLAHQAHNDDTGAACIVLPLITSLKHTPASRQATLSFALLHERHP